MEEIRKRWHPERTADAQMDKCIRRTNFRFDGARIGEHPKDCNARRGETNPGEIGSEERRTGCGSLNLLLSLCGRKNVSENGTKRRKDGVKVTGIVLGFRKEVAQTLGAQGFYLCFQCGACVGNCPVARVSSEFNPRKIVFNVLMGLRNDLIRADSAIWKCATCYSCQERCPQDASPVKVIGVLKGMCIKAGVAPQEFVSTADIIRRTGRAVAVSSAIEKRRTVMGLPPLSKIPTAELELVLKS